MNRKPGERGHTAVELESASGSKSGIAGTIDVENELGAKPRGLTAEGRTKVGRSSKRLLMNGVVLMAGAALLSKLIGVFQKIPLQNLAGDRVFGIYNAVYPFYQLAASLATAGLPTAVALLIAERLRKGNDAEGVRRTLYAALLLLGITGIIAFSFMWAGADHVASWIGDSETAGAIRSVSFALLLAPFVAALLVHAGTWKHGTLSVLAGRGAIDTCRRYASCAWIKLVSGLERCLCSFWGHERLGVWRGSRIAASRRLLLAQPQSGTALL